jgi:hypothetical protein
VNYYHNIFAILYALTISNVVGKIKENKCSSSALNKYLRFVYTIPPILFTKGDEFMIREPPLK